MQISGFGVINLSMGNEEKSGEFYEEKQALDDAARAHGEQIRMGIREEKEKSIGPHFKNIDPDDLNYDDLIVWDRFKKGILTEDYFFKYYHKLLGGIGKTNEEILADSRRNFAAMILNKTIAEEARKKKEEKQHREAA